MGFQSEDEFRMVLNRFPPSGDVAADEAPIDIGQSQDIRRDPNRPSVFFAFRADNFENRENQEERNEDEIVTGAQKHAGQANGR